MARYLWVLALYGVAGGVYWQNGRGTGTLIVFPWIEALVGPDPQTMGRATVLLLVGIATLMGVLTAFNGRRASADD